MNFVNLFEHTANIINIINSAPLAAENSSSDYFRKNKKIGSKERKFIANTAFSAIRNLLLINSFIDENSDKKQQNKLTVVITLILGVNKLINDYDPELLFQFTAKTNKVNLIDSIHDFLQSIKNQTKEDFNNWIINIENEIKALDIEIERNINSSNTASGAIEAISTRYSMPDWILQNWIDSGISLGKAAEIAKSLLFQADIGIRVNRNIVSRQEIVDYFNSIGIDAEISTISPDGIKLTNRPAMHEVLPYRNGLIEVQDIGSQIIAHTLNPTQGQTILDACAGAGGKALHIATLQNDNGKIFALDITSKKLKELNKRSNKAGFRSISTLSVRAGKAREAMLKSKFPMAYDAVLVDAPCSGMGTVRRDPVRKYKLNPDLLKRLSDNQLSILMEYSEFVKYGGTLVYATCSLMYDENQGVVNQFLQNRKDFEPDSLKPIFEAQNIPIQLADNDFMVTITPDIYDSDGFFMARMKRVK